MKIKICGVTTLSNAKELAKLDIHYLGFIFYKKSSRNIAPDKAENITKKLKKINNKIKFVGVFVDEPIENVKKIIKKANLDIVQLHGNESPDYCKKLKNLAEVWKSIIVNELKDIQKIKIYENIVDKILLDAGKGSGKQIDFSLLKNIKVEILAGGIGLDNIKETIKTINPKIIDLNSKVEISPGIKNVECIQKIIKFIQKNV